MPVENKYADSRFATGELLEKNYGANALKVLKSGPIAIAAADDDLSVYRVFRIPMNSIIISLKVSNDAITGGTEYDVGIHDIGVNGAVIDRDIFTDATTMVTARRLTEILTAPAIGDLHKFLWQYTGLGFTKDPEKMVDVTITGVVVGTAAGNIYLELTYI